MRVYHDEAGVILYTLAADHPPQLVGTWIDVPDQALGDLTDWRVEAGTLVAAGLEGARAAARRAVNAEVGAVRARYITMIPGQEMLYLRKEAEATGWLSEVTPDPADYPLIAAEIGITGSDGDQVAQVYLNLGAAWQQIAAVLEAIRLGAIAAIDAAGDRATIDAIGAGIAAQLTAAGF